MMVELKIFDFNSIKLIFLYMKMSLVFQLSQPFKDTQKILFQ